MPSGDDAIRDQITHLVAAIQQDDEPCVIHRGMPWLWLPGVVCALDIPFTELDEDDQAAFMETIPVGHWQAPDSEEDWLMIPLAVVLSDLVFRGRSAHAREFVQWLTQHVYPAMLEHGTYDPATNHALPTGSELDTLEMRERWKAMAEHFMSQLHEGDHLYG